MPWMKRAYRGFPNSEHAPAVIKLLVQNFGEGTFRASDADPVVMRYNAEERARSDDHSTYWFQLANLFKRGVVERRPLAKRVFLYRFVPEALKESRHLV